MSVSQAAPKPPLMVLVVDDEPGFRNLLDWELTSQGMTVETAPNGAEGVRMASQKSGRAAFALPILREVQP